MLFVMVYITFDLVLSAYLVGEHQGGRGYLHGTGAHVLFPDDRNARNSA